MTGRFLPNIGKAGNFPPSAGNNRLGLHVNPCKNSHILSLRGADQCTSSNRPFFLFSWAAALQPAATRPANRRFTAAAPVRPLPRQPRTTRSQVLSSVLAPISRPANSATRSVTDTTHAIRRRIFSRVAGLQRPAPGLTTPASSRQSTRLQPPCVSHRAAFRRFSAPRGILWVFSGAPIRVAAPVLAHAQRPSKPKDVPCSTRS